MTQRTDEAERFAIDLEAALMSDPAASRRLRRARVASRFIAPDGAVTLVPDDQGLQIVDGEHGAPVELRFEPGALDRFASGHLSLATALLHGEATATGPVRSILAVAPIMSGLLRNSGGSLPPREGPLDPPAGDDLLDGMWSIHVNDLHKGFGRTPVLEGIDLRVPEGAITVVLGPSGTGKSVLLKHLIGLLAPDRGEVAVHGQNVSALSIRELLDLRRRCGILFQDGALFGSMSVYDNVAFPLRQHTDLPEATIERVVLARLEDVGLADAADRAPGALSGGMRKRVGFARALVLEPEIVLFDEPDSGLDPVRTSLLSDLILRLHPRFGGTYVVITHDIAVARKLGEYLAVLWQGRVVAAGPRDAIFASPDPFVRQFLAGDPKGPLGME